MLYILTLSLSLSLSRGLCEYTGRVTIALTSLILIYCLLNIANISFSSLSSEQFDVLIQASGLTGICFIIASLNIYKVGTFQFICQQLQSYLNNHTAGTQQKLCNALHESLCL